MATVTTCTQTLLVKPAFLQEIKDSNPDLWHLVHQLRAITDSQGQPGAVVRNLVRILDDLRDQLAMQFALEESYGYIRVPGSVITASADPSLRQSLCGLTEAAHSQHCGLYLQLSDLAEQAEESQYRGATIENLNLLLRAASRFDESLRDHELLEQDLIEQSFQAKL